MSAATVKDSAGGRKRLGVYAMFDCERRPSDAFIRSINAARRFPFDIGTPKRVQAARDRKRRP